LINDLREVGNVPGNCPGGMSRGREMLGDVRGQCLDTVPEWHKRNLVTLIVYSKGLQLADRGPKLAREGQTIGPQSSAKMLKTFITFSI